MPILGIREKSWHFRVWSSLHKLWDGSIPSDPRSLCGYSQYIFWIGLVTFISLPLMLLGWGIVKSQRWLYKTLSKSRFGNWLAEFEASLEEHELKTWGSHIERASYKFETMPGSTATCWGLMTLFVIVASAVVVVVLFAGVTAIILLIPKIPLFLWHCLLWGGWGLFYACCGIGWFVIHTGILLKYLGICIWAFLPVIGFWAGCIVGMAALAVGIVLLMIRFAHSRWGQGFIDFLVFKYNGFAAARQNYNEKREELRGVVRQKIEQKAIERKSHPHKPSIIVTSIVVTFKCFRGSGKWLKETFWTGRRITTKQGTVNEIGVIPLLGHTLVAIYKGICPMTVIIREPQESTENDPQ